MSTASLFKWRHFLPAIIPHNVRWWHCRYALSHQDLEEMMQERGMEGIIPQSTMSAEVRSGTG
ncbi:hypothetical protein IFO70_36815 [Phormidium tenue FACHB-886]|nr:hypothetical protein [Phormidium tenue FACHB-886]